MSKLIENEIPHGTLLFHDNYIPELHAAKWEICIDQFIEKDGKSINLDSGKNPVPLNARQEFIVSAPQFSLPPNAIAEKFPPEGSCGLYKDILPHIILDDPLLPWERSMKNKNQPWLALLVFTEDELSGSKTSETRSSTCTVGEFLKQEPGILKGAITKESDITDTDICSFIHIPVSVFRELMPQSDELSLLTHCRKVNTEDKAENNKENKFFSVVVANRFPAIPLQDESQAQKNIVHLVSLEGLDNYLTAKAEFGNFAHVSLTSLASWTFSTLPATKNDFRGLAEGLIQSAAKPEQELLRVPLPEKAKIDRETLNRLNEGFVPLPYHTRTGEEMPAWYRGPFAPVLPAELKKSNPFFTSDSALIYDKAHGLFDASLAAAWTIGRAVALADKNFAQLLYELRRKAHRSIDQLLYRESSNYFTESNIDKIDIQHRVQDQLSDLINAKFISEIAKHVPVKAKTKQKKEIPVINDPIGSISSFIQNKKNLQKLSDIISMEASPVSKWLTRLALLYPVPFDYLVPDGKMLPEESIRFFYIDSNWISALTDGALSIGLESSRETELHSVLNPVLQKTVMKSVSSYRKCLFGKVVSEDNEESKPVCGLLLRSALVSGWPGLAIRPYKKGSDELLNFLRFERISANVILCLFDSIPDYIEIAEPHESLRFGTDENGTIPLRNFIAPVKRGDPETGEQLSGFPVLKIRDITGNESCCMRSAKSRTLRLSPSDSQSLFAQLKLHNVTAKELTPASFAMQMVKSPEAIRFFSQTKKATK